MNRTLTTFETTINSDGRLDSPTPFPVSEGTRVLITILDDDDDLDEIRRRAEELDRDPSMGMTMDEFGKRCPTGLPSR